MLSKRVGMSKGTRSKRGTLPGSKGARRATEGAGGGVLPGQRWSAGRNREVVLRMLRGESLDALSRELGVEIYRAGGVARQGALGAGRRASGGRGWFG